MAKKKKIISQKDVNFFEGLTFHSKRSHRSRAIDESKTAKKVYNYPTSAWKKNPGASDVKNIDTKKYAANGITEVINYVRATSMKFNKLQFERKSKNVAIVRVSSVNDKNTLKRIINIRYKNVLMTYKHRNKNEIVYYIKVRK